MHSSQQVLLALVLGMAGVCCEATGEPVALRESASINSQGVSMQGVSMQGVSLQGVSLQGVSMQGVSMQGMSLSGTVLSGQVVENGTLRTLSGADLVGAQLTGMDENGMPVLLTIAAVDVDPLDALGEILLYTVLYQDRSGAWQNLCTADPTGLQRAVPMAGLWDARGGHHDSASEFTLGCTSGVIAKCARWGYRPWESVGGQSLVDLHQACTRMARADYCGDGVSHTRNGTYIDMYDVLGIQRQVPRDGMLFEAAWTPTGAYCVARERWNLLAPTLLLECPGKLSLPDLSDLLNQDSCAMKLSSGPRSGAPSATGPSCNWSWPFRLL